MIFHSILCYLLFDDYAGVIYYRCNMQLNVYVIYIYICHWGSCCRIVIGSGDDVAYHAIDGVALNGNVGVC